MNVLLVDDEEKFVSRLAERLSIRGFEVNWATTGKTALAMAKSKRFDLAVLDVKMPFMGGIELKNRLLQLHPNMRFILVTGHGSDEDYEIGSKEAAFYIIKPFKIEYLVKKINQILNA